MNAGEYILEQLETYWPSKKTSAAIAGEIAEVFAKYNWGRDVFDKVLHRYRQQSKYYERPPVARDLWPYMPRVTKPVADEPEPTSPEQAALNRKWAQKTITMLSDKMRVNNDCQRRDVANG